MSVQQNNFRCIADKIREKTNKTELIKPIDFADKIDEVYDEGKKAEYDRFWNSYQSNGEIKSYSYAFCGNCWTDETLNPKYTPLKATATTQMFRFCAATVLPSIDFNDCLNLDQTYYYAREAVTIGTVILKDDGTNTFNNAFGGCSELVNISFEGVIGNSLAIGSASKLTSESVDNIIDHLKDLTETTAQTITFHSTVVNNLTESQLENIRNKNWIVG